MRHKSYIDELTLEEKASLLSGANFWNTKSIERLAIPSMMLTDGPHGLRKQGGKADHLGLNESIPATCFPTAATLANSWDVSLTRQVGDYIGREAVAENVGVVLGPGLNIVRNPLGGRTFEYYSEDPYLSGHLAAGLVEGIQSHGIAASPKHFAVNSQETMRMSMDEIVDERSFREIYLEGFRYVVQHTKPKTIMSSYNKINGTYANEHPHLLGDILKKEWGFDGVVVTDWGAENDRVAGLRAGNQLEMPSSGGITDQEIVAAVRNGELDEAIVDNAVDDVLELVFSTEEALKARPSIDVRAHHQKAVEAAERSMVLLKNGGSILPLKPKTRVAIIGDFAEMPRYQGAGSSLVNPFQLDSALEALRQTKLMIVGYEKGFKRRGGNSRRLRERAVRLAETADVVLLFLGLDESMESEGVDRPHMRLASEQLALVEELTSWHKRVVVVLAGGAPIEMPFVDKVPAILHSFLGGQGGGQAVANLLTGKANPSGKLAITYPRSYQDVPSAKYFPGQEATSEHREGIYVGYRYYDTKDVPVLFPFGHGLSYTKFHYSDLRVDGNGVSLTVKNSGHVAGEEIVQIYVKPLKSKVPRAKRELKGFVKVALAPGESRRISLVLDEHAFSYYNVRADRWVEEPGDYEIQAAASLADVRLTKTVTRKGEAAPAITVPAAYKTADIQNVSRRDFEELLGRKVPSAKWNRKQPLTLADTVGQLRYKNLLGRFTYGLLISLQRLLFWLGRPNAANNVTFIISMPFGKFDRFSGGKVSRRSLERFLRWINK